MRTPCKDYVCLTCTLDCFTVLVEKNTLKNNGEFQGKTASNFKVRS